MTSQTYMRPIEAAGYLCVSVSTLEGWRRDGIGPKFKKFGQRVVYSVADMDAWAESRTRQSTRDAEPESMAS